MHQHLSHQGQRLWNEIAVEQFVFSIHKEQDRHSPLERGQEQSTQCRERYVPVSYPWQDVLISMVL